MSEQIIYSLSLAVTIVFSFVLSSSEVASDSLFVLAGLFVVFFIIKNIWPRKTGYSYFLESILVTFSVLQIVNTTGNLRSPFFPLLYFLIFALSMLLDPIIGLSESFILLIFYLWFYNPAISIEALSPLFALLLLSPFAAFLSLERRRNRSLSENNLLFLSLIIKKHLETIRQTAQNYSGDHDLEVVIRTVDRLDRLIDRFEKESNP